MRQGAILPLEVFSDTEYLITRLFAIASCAFYWAAILSAATHSPRILSALAVSEIPYPPALIVSSGLGVPSCRSRTPRHAARKLNRFGTPRYSHTYGLAVSNANSSRRDLDTRPQRPRWRAVETLTIGVHAEMHHHAPCVHLQAHARDFGSHAPTLARLGHGQAQLRP